MGKNVEKSVRSNFVQQVFAALVAFLLVYVLSFWFFYRSHTLMGIGPGATVTSEYWELKDTKFNRALMAFYSPLRCLRPFNSQVDWY